MGCIEFSTIRCICFSRDRYILSYRTLGSDYGEPMKDGVAKTMTRFGIAAFFIGVGVAHFVKPDPFVYIMPPYLPWHLELVYISGFFEVLGGIGLCLIKYVQAGWGLIALLVAVYPANIHMLVNEVYLPDMPRSKAILWARMPCNSFWGLWCCGFQISGLVPTTRAFKSALRILLVMGG